jgi:transposase-like protein
MAGRPSKYDPDKHPELVRKLCLLGATDEQMADALEIEPSTFYVWKSKHPEFAEAIKKGKAYADANVGERLYNRALGYEQPIEKVFCSEGMIVTHQTHQHIPADTTAMIFWLKNRRPDLWRDKRIEELQGPDGTEASPIVFIRTSKPEEPKP